MRFPNDDRIREGNDDSSHLIPLFSAKNSPFLKQVSLLYSSIVLDNTEYVRFNEEV